jgi:hypothetical protein
MMIRTPYLRMVALVLLAAVFNACALWKPAPPKLNASHWSVQVPRGWMQLSSPDYEMFSKYGPYLQYVLIQVRPISQSFRFTHQKLNGDMLPHEAARVILANLTSDTQIKNFSLISNEPAIIDRAMGFKLTYSYTDPQGVAIKSIYFGVINDGLFISLQYTAAQRHYFAAGLAEFCEIQRSFRLSTAS